MMNDLADLMTVIEYERNIIIKKEMLLLKK